MKFKKPALLRQRRIDTPLGTVLLARTPAGLAGLWFEGQRHAPLHADIALWASDEADALLREAERQVLDYFAGHREAFDLPLDLSHGTPFQQAVWQALCRIERGQTVRYGALAAQIGLPTAVRAVGAAVGRNPLSVVVPCHRVIGTDGSLTGYAGGLARKVHLLKLEGAAYAPLRAARAPGEAATGFARHETCTPATAPTGRTLSARDGSGARAGPEAGAETADAGRPIASTATPVMARGPAAASPDAQA